MPESEKIINDISDIENELSEQFQNKMEDTRIFVLDNIDNASIDDLKQIIEFIIKDVKIESHNIPDSIRSYFKETS